jgi:ribonuclease III
MKQDYLSELQNLIKIKFNKIEILKKSLVHKSFDSKSNNEKLEFLGDRVLGLVLSKKLLEIYPNEKEGVIDKKFANLVNKKICAEIANTINLKKYIIIGDSFRGLSRSSEKIISDALEALIGAIFIDKGLSSSEKFILTFWKDYLNKSDFTKIDSKTMLQEFSLKKYKELPNYKVYKQVGPDHNPVFKVEVSIPGSKKSSGSGKSKKNAQQNAAEKLLSQLKIL